MFLTLQLQIATDSFLPNHVKFEARTLDPNQVGNRHSHMQMQVAWI